MDLFTIVATIAIGIVGGLGSWLTKKGAERYDSQIMEQLMEQLDDVLWGTVLAGMKSDIAKALRKQTKANVTNEFLRAALDKLEVIAPIIVKKLKFTEDGLKEYVRSSIKELIENILEEDGNAKPQEG